jgi:hypothetical protein
MMKRAKGATLAEIMAGLREMTVLHFGSVE